jgi:hypothetical protein
MSGLVSCQRVVSLKLFGALVALKGSNVVMNFLVPSEMLNARE